MLDGVAEVEEGSACGCGRRGLHRSAASMFDPQGRGQNLTVRTMLPFPRHTIGVKCQCASTRNELKDHQVAGYEPLRDS